ncbi:MAG: S41 family peptidase [Sinomicrobium sp.]|nr:S41 family peptidase [Sinomicrobium sp.]
MLTRKKYLTPVVIGAALAAGIFIGGKLHFDDTPEKLFATNSKKDKLNRLIDYIDYEYVDDVNTDSIVEVTVNSILDKLDPHSVYIPREDMQKATETMQGDFVGIGVSFYMYNDTLSVIRPLEGGPSIEAGIQPGDRILTADGDTLYGKGLKSETIIGRLKGTAGTPVQLKVYREGKPALLDFNIKRAKVPIKSVNAYYMLTDALGYIKINRFAETAYKEFKTALDALLETGMTKLVLDLRDNPGGYLNVTEQIADEFLDKNKLILFTRNKKGTIKKAYATKKGDFENGEIYVLINEKSASASEIIAGALQDNDKGTIIGRRSFGKGLVQQEMPLPDGSAIRLTVSRYYTPTGRSIQRSYENGTKDYYDDYYERYNNGELRSADSIKVADSLKFRTPKGKIVYGGGGIIPDIFIPLELSIEEEWVTANVLQSGFMDFFVFEYLDKDRTQYSDYTQQQFSDTVEVSDALVQEFVDYAVKRGLTIDFSKYRQQLKKYIKATIAEQLYGTNVYEQICNKDDSMIRKAIALSRGEKAQ